MYYETDKVPCTIMRGGTSKGIFFMENQLPSDPKERDALVCAIMGSPDIRQIDGLGGADTLTSKLAILGPPSVPDADVDYTFGQVSLTDAFVDYGGNCGNISSAVGPYAIDKGLVRAVEPVTEVRIHMTNTGKRLVARVPVTAGKARVRGDLHIDGVPGTGAAIVLDWSGAVAGCTGRLLPTGQATDTLEIDGASYTVSVVDAGNIVIFIPAEDFHLTGSESPSQIDADTVLMGRIERIRGEVCVKIGLVPHWEDAAIQTPFQPFFCIVSPPQPYETISGTPVHTEEIDMTARLLFMLKMHKAYPVTGTIATGAAARIAGSVVWQCLSQQARASSVLRIGHPAGVISMTAVVGAAEGTFSKLETERTARMLMDGFVFVTRKE